MRNLKKLLAVIVAVCTVLAFTVPAFAADAAAAPADSKVCSDLGVLKGDTADGVTAAYLAKGTTRLQAAILQLRLLGKEAEAYAETSTENFADADLVTWADGKALLAYLKKNPDLGWVGTDGKFDPAGACTAQMLYKVLLESVGFKTGTDFQYADTIKFAGTKGLAKLAAATNLTNNDVATGLVEALKAKTADGKTTFAQKLIDANIIAMTAAETAGLVPKAVALDLAGAIAINSKVVEVTLGTAASAKDIAAAGALTIKDSAAKDVVVSKIEFAPWATDSKDLLVTLAADTTAGTFYTVTCGTKTANFGGKAVDATAPTVAAVNPADFDNFTIDFSEPILLGGTVTAALKYSPNTDLKTSTIAYVDKDTIKVTNTVDQAVSLYGVAIKGFKDLAGNAMADKTDLTFVGVAKDSAAFAGITVTTLDSNVLQVNFGKKFDTATCLDATKYTVKLKYAPNTEIKVSSVAADANVATAVDLTLASDADAALYEVTVATGVKTFWGVATTAAMANTVVGTGKDTSPLAINKIETVSNTKVKITFGTDAVKDAVDAATTKDMFSIKLNYAPNTELAISAITIKDNTVTLTTAAQASALYAVTIKTGIKDKKGNATTADLSTTFVGQAVAAKIAAVKSITRVSDTQITVKFDVNVGASVTDVSHYSIDGGVGYPEKAETTANADEVKLTIPKTSVGTLYTLTVKGLENADGVAMDAAGITFKFSGQGNPATNSTVQAVMALDAQTLEVYFDRAVTDAKIKGPLYTGTTLVAGAFLYNDLANAAEDIAGYGEYVYADPANANGLIIRVDNTSAFKSANYRAGATMFTLTVDATKVKNTTGMPFAAKDTAPTNPSIAGIVANDSKTLTVYFSEDVAGVDAGDFTISDAVNGGAPAGPAVNTVFAVDAKTYKLGIAAMTKSSYYLTVGVGGAVDANETVEGITDKTGLVSLKATTASATAADFASYQFAASTATVANISSIPVSMSDARTMVVYYPEAMVSTGGGGTDVTVPANYTIENYAGGGGANTLVPTANIKQITWDGTTNTAKLIFNVDVGASTTGYYVKFANTLANVIGTKVVLNSDATAVRSQFAVNAAAAAKVTISSVTYNSTTGAITIKLNQKVRAGTDLITDPDFSETLADIGISTIVSGAADAIDAAEIASVSANVDGGAAVADTTGNDFNTIVVTLTTGAGSQVASMDATLVATVSLKAGFTGINGMGTDTASTGVFIQ